MEPRTNPRDDYVWLRLLVLPGLTCLAGSFVGRTPGLLVRERAAACRRAQSACAEGRASMGTSSAIRSVERPVIASKRRRKSGRGGCV